MKRNYKEYHKIVNTKKVYLTKEEIIDKLEKELITYEHNRPWRIEVNGNVSKVYNIANEVVWMESGGDTKNTLDTPELHTLGESAFGIKFK